MSVKLVPSTSCAANTAAAPQAPWRRCGGRMCEQRHAPGRGGRPGGAVRGDRGGRRSGGARPGRCGLRAVVDLWLGGHHGPSPGDRPDRSGCRPGGGSTSQRVHRRSEEHTSELQSLMRISYAVFCLKKKKKNKLCKNNH